MIKMKHTDTGKLADVHESEVKNMKAYGWAEAEVKPEVKKRVSRSTKNDS